MLKKNISGVAALLLAAALSACGGGGGSNGGSSTSPGNNGGNGGNGSSTNDGSWLTFRSTLDDILVFPGQPARAGITAQSSKVISETFNGALTDNIGVFNPDVRMDPTGSPLIYVFNLQTRAGLPAGVHTGALELKLCYDAPTTCARPIAGSPWQLPYKITVLAESDLHYSRWETATPSAPFVYGMQLATIGSSLAMVSVSPYAPQIQTWLSSDNADSWQLSPAAGPTPVTNAYATAGDGTALYLSGGRDSNNNDTNHVWKFDGARWTQRTAAGEFLPREQHLMAKLGSDIYLMGGVNGSQQLSDVWKSSDDGSHWSRLATLPAALGRPTCALGWRGSLVVIGDTVITSSDGKTWTERPVASKSFPYKSSQCAVLKDRLYVTPSDGYGRPYSTADLQTWQPERADLGRQFAAQGMAALNGRLFIAAGVGTSSREVMRTVP